jgi:hypothetical protein
MKDRHAFQRFDESQANTTCLLSRKTVTYARKMSLRALQQVLVAKTEGGGGRGWGHLVVCTMEVIALGCKSTTCNPVRPCYKV